MFVHPSAQPTGDESFLLINDQSLKQTVRPPRYGWNPQSSIMVHPRREWKNVKTDAANSDKSCFVNNSMWVLLSVDSVTPFVQLLFDISKEFNNRSRINPPPP